MKEVFEFFKKVYHYRYLLTQMTKREIANRYRGSVLEFVWAFLNPLLMLAVYTFVFSVVFKARWGEVGVEESQVDFAIVLFAGLLTFNLFADILNRAPYLVLSNANYVKKVIFPLELLPLVSIGTVLFHSSLSLLALLVVQLLTKGYIPWTAFYIPFVILPVLLAGLGVSWLLSALTVYIRDIPQITGLVTTILLFVSSVFFPISALPEKYQLIISLNPLALIVSESRKVLAFGQPPDWKIFILTLLIGALIALIGYWWFQKARKGFADVL
jgi:lipopolysaccharide transport system permease protein